MRKGYPALSMTRRSTSRTRWIRRRKSRRAGHLVMPITIIHTRQSCRTIYRGEEQGVCGAARAIYNGFTQPEPELAGECTLDKFDLSAECFIQKIPGERELHGRSGMAP